jgi:hypothetical protein
MNGKNGRRAGAVLAALLASGCAESGDVEVPSGHRVMACLAAEAEKDHPLASVFFQPSLARECSETGPAHAHHKSSPTATVESNAVRKCAAELQQASDRNSVVLIEQANACIKAAVAKMTHPASEVCLAIANTAIQTGDQAFMDSEAICTRKMAPVAKARATLGANP